MLQNVQIGTFVIFMCAAIFTDLYRMKIPNVLVGMCLGGFFVFAILNGMAWSDILLHVAAALVVFLVALIPYNIGAMAAGDVKFIAAIALWFGFGGELIAFVILLSLYGGLLAFAILSYRQLPLPALVRSWTWAANLYNPAKGVPYGVAIAAAAISLRTAVL
ncbi:prepilin peptidase [Microvirga sp. BT688]|uniref:A24 family peptidase n=1 Tax=Microvirga sp. TaxID=1873136 RepID=UPI00168969FB|nr:prepilin peptidase [Microvirga sp.]MBD2745767.1 prepilin peptidase [Microvirga sp.]